MPAPLLAEGSVTLILDHIKANIAGALSAVRVDRDDAKVAIPVPRTYFIYEDAKGYQSPAIFVICEEFDFKISENAANHINGVARINISALVEDREKSFLTYKAWRYQSALHGMLAENTLTTTDNKLTITIVVKRASFSPAYSSVANKQSTEAVFRKEVLLECDVVHRENY